MSGDFVGDAKAELSGMAKEGMRHPSTRPVLTGAAIGAAAGLVLPVLSIIGAGIAFYKRLRP